MASTSATKKATSMADLMRSATKTVKTIHKGEFVEGTITKLTSAEILVDIGAKAEATVLEKDKRLLHNLLTSLYVGDAVTVSVLNPESDYGSPVVSLRRFTDDKMWDKLTQLQKSQESVDVAVEEATKGGFLVAMGGGISGFLPNSHVSFAQGDQHLVGKTIKVVVLEVNRTLRKIIFSQKGNMGIEEFKDITKTFHPGQKIGAIVTNITPFGVFLRLQTPDGKPIEGMVHVSEVAWEKVEDLQDRFSPGDTIEGEIIGFDRDSRRVNISLKRLTTDPREEALRAYKKDQKVTAVIEKVLTRGVIFKVADPANEEKSAIDGFMKKESIPPTVTYTEGQEIQATVSDIDTKNHRLLLSPVLLEKPIGYR